MSDTGKPPTRWGAYVAQRLDELERGDGDFTDLKRPSAATVAHARRAAAETFRDTTPTPSVVPTAEGGIDFVWHKNGYDVEWCITEHDAEFWAECRATGKMYDEQFMQLLLDALDALWPPTPGSRTTWAPSSPRSPRNSASGPSVTWRPG